MPDFPHVFADFSEARDDGLISVMTDGTLRVNQVVVLTDDEGNSCYGRVKILSGGVADVAATWSTLRRPSENVMPTLSDPTSSGASSAFVSPIPYSLADANCTRLLVLGDAVVSPFPSGGE